MSKQRLCLDLTTPSKLCLDLKLQFVEYLCDNYILTWFKLFTLDKDFNNVYLYNLRKNRYILTKNEIKELDNFLLQLQQIETNQSRLYIYYESDFIYNLFINEYKKSVENGYLQLLKYLILNDLDIHYDSDYAIQWAMENGNLSILKYLVSNGLNMHECHYLAFRFAACLGYLKIVKYLHQNGAYIHAANNGALRMSATKGHLQVVKYLVKHGADIHAVNNYALRYAAENGHLEVVKYLVKHGANVNVLTTEQCQRYGI